MLVGQNRIGIFFYLFRRFKISFIRPIVVVFTIVSRVFTTDGRPRIVNPATVIVHQVFARRVDQKVPSIVLSKDAGTIMQQIPTHEFVVPSLFWCVDRQSEVTTAFRRAIIAKDFARF